MEEKKEQLKLQKKGEQLAELEDKIKECHKEEIKNRFEIGRLLNLIKERKLYYYKDSEGNYTWDYWCKEFYGSRRTAERYIDLWFIFLHYYKYRISELSDICGDRFDTMIPLLKSGDVKNKDDVDKILEMARTVPSNIEFKKALIQKDMPLKDVMDCAHIFSYYIKCKVCGEQHKVPRNKIINPEEIEKNF